MCKAKDREINEQKIIKKFGKLPDKSNDKTVCKIVIAPNGDLVVWTANAKPVMSILTKVGKLGSEEDC